MQSELYSLSKLFTETIYRIPDFQRGYAWGERQIRDFWSDLEQLQLEGNHYTGVLHLEPVSETQYAQWEDDVWLIESKRFVPFYVVDGQQRLTTIIVLLQCLIAAIGNNEVNYTSVSEIRSKFIFQSKGGGSISRSFLFGYEKDNPSYEFLKTVIFQERSDSHSTAEETIYTHNLLSAKSFFEEKVSELSLPQLEELYTKVTQRVLFNVYVIAREIDVFVAFETMNNRGKRLSQLELLKNRLIFLSTRFTVDSTEKALLRRTINESWKTVYHYLGKNRRRPLDDNVFLITHQWLAFPPDPETEEEKPYGDRRHFSHYDDDEREFLLDSVFNLRNMPGNARSERSYELSVEYLYKFAHAIKDTVKLYYGIWNPADSEVSDEEKIWLERLCRIADEDEILLIVAAYQVEAEPAVRLAFLRTLERTLFLHGISGYLFRLEGDNYAARAAKLVSRVLTVAEISGDLASEMGKRLSDVDVGTAIREWVKRAYGSKGLRYFMFEYEQELKSASKTKREKLTWHEFALERYEDDYTTIEHIFPQKVTASCWRTPFQRFGVAQRNTLRNSIGNLLPLSRPKNSSLSNKCFDEKKKSSQDTTVGYSYGCYSENEVAQSLEWTAKEIVARSIKLLEFFEKRWEIPLGDKSTKTHLLGLDFVSSG